MLTHCLWDYVGATARTVPFPSFLSPAGTRSAGCARIRSFSPYYPDGQRPRGPGTGRRGMRQYDEHNLVIRAGLSEDPRVLAAVTPEQAGWNTISFRAYWLPAGETREFS